IGSNRRLRGQPIEKFKSCLRTAGHGNGDGTIQAYDRRWCELRECVVKRHDTGPVSALGSEGWGVTGGDRRLKCIWAKASVEPLRALESSEAAANEELIPMCTILL